MSTAKPFRGEKQPRKDSEIQSRTFSWGFTCLLAAKNITLNIVNCVKLRPSVGIRLIKKMSIRQAQRPRHVRNANRAVVLQLLRRHQRLSRAEIARRSGLSEASVSRIVAELLPRRLVVEDGVGQSTGGRPAIRLQLDQGRYRSIGVDIHNRETRFSIGTMGGRVIEDFYFPTPTDPLKTLDLIAEHVEAQRRRPGPQQLEGIGIAARGLVNSKTGVVERGNDPHWVSIPVRDYLQKRLGLPVYLENTGRAAAFAEYHYGSPETQGAHCLLFVKVDEGIGTSIILDGKLYYGRRMAAGEFGQMVIADSGGPERHDRPGCLEKLASNIALCARYQELSEPKRGGGFGDIAAQAQHICHLAMGGDEAARQAIRETCRYLGIGLANLVWGLDPDAIVIDGAITEAWPLVAPVIQEQFADGREFLNFRNLRLRPSALGGDAAIIGALALPFNSLFATGESGSTLQQGAASAGAA